MDLKNLDFVTESDDFSPSQIRLPDEMPARSRQEISPELLKSNTVENLISQNQDLMNRLSVALRRLSSLENENQRVSEENRKTQLQFQNYRETIQVLSKSDTQWKQKVEILETEKQVAHEKSQLFSERLHAAQTQLLKFEKYQEKVRTQYKPYVQELKSIISNLENENKDLQGKVHHSAAQVADIRAQIIEVTQASKAQLDSETRKSQEMISYYETEISALQRDLAEKAELLADRELKTVRLQKTLEKCDYLENELVVLTRSKEEMKIRLEEEMMNYRIKAQELTRQNQRLGMEHADLQVRVIEVEAERSTLQKETFSIKEQLDSLRYMWNSKNDETERLKSALQSLEKINLDLSEKINEFRRSEGPSPQ